MTFYGLYIGNHAIYIIAQVKPSALSNETACYVIKILVILQYAILCFEAMGFSGMTNSPNGYKRPLSAGGEPAVEQQMLMEEMSAYTIHCVFCPVSIWM